MLLFQPSVIICKKGEALKNWYTPRTKADPANGNRMRTGGLDVAGDSDVTTHPSSVMEFSIERTKPVCIGKLCRVSTDK